MPIRPDPETLFQGQPGFDEEPLPRLVARPFFRLATTEEIDRSYDAYCTGDGAILLSTWEAVASPIRAALPGIHGFMHRNAGALPRRLLGLAFLSTMRGVLSAGRRVRQTLRPDLAAAIGSEFPWLDERHTHIPPGSVPPFDFPPEFAAFLQGGTLDEGRARWQLAAALNEVQQAHCSESLGRLFALPELSRHAQRERELAQNYFANWSPRATRALWAQCIYVLDGLNAAVFSALSGTSGLVLRARALAGLFFGGAEWRAFCEGLERPQRLLSPGAQEHPDRT